MDEALTRVICFFFPKEKKLFDQVEVSSFHVSCKVLALKIYKPKFETKIQF